MNRHPAAAEAAIDVIDQMPDGFDGTEAEWAEGVEMLHFAYARGYYDDVFEMANQMGLADLAVAVQPYVPVRPADADEVC